MKVESKFVINGRVVSKEFESDSLVIYEDLADQAVYIVNKQTSECIVKIDIEPTREILIRVLTYRLLHWLTLWQRI